MDPILSEVYSTVLPAAPYVLAAYVGILAHPVRLRLLPLA